MFSSYRDFEITIDAIGVASHPMFVRGPGGEARGILASLSGDLTYEALAMRLQHLDIDETALTELGQILFRSVFQGPIKDVYTRSQGELQQGQGLRLKLNIDVHEAAVAALPWEFLHDPDQGPLALLDAPIVRYLPQQAVIPTLETKLPLNVLLTAAQTAPPVNIERELHEVQQSFAQLGSFVQITVEDHLTTAKFQKLLREGNFHIWHFVGHGGFNQNSSTGELAFEDAAGEVQFVSASQLGVLLKRSSVRLVILDACDSARLAINPLMSIAPALIHAQIPAVVAMQFPIPEDATRAFASEFYRALAEGFPIDACVTEGRKAVMNATGLGNPDWGIPVVYTRAQDGMLFDLPPLPKPPCPYPGMAPFVEADSRRFFGRAREIQEMLGSFCQSGSGCGRVQVYHNETGEMMGRYELTDEQYALIEPVLPTNAGKTGHPYDPHRPIINGIFWRLHAGAAWRFLPAFGDGDIRSHIL